MTELFKGSCLCGAVQYEARGPLRPSVACHCSQCRKTSGHYWSATQVPDANLSVTKDEGLRWFQSSDKARRGFCRHCGASLFWQLKGEGTTSIGSGTLDNSGDMITQKHICVADKGSYYMLTDALPKLEKW